MFSLNNVFNKAEKNLNIRVGLKKIALTNVT